MKFSTFCCAVVLALFTVAHASASPKVFNKKAVDRVATFTKVWGLMKYYHPEVAAGSINWDSVYVATMPKVVAAKTEQEFYVLMDKFYGQVPSPKLAASYNLPKADTVKCVFSAKEISSYQVSSRLQQQLRDLYERHLPVDSKYITNKYKEYTLDYVLFTENPMAEQAYPDQETRLLALARYWNAINFFYPHRNTVGKSWEKVLQQYVPVFAAAPNELEYHLAIQRLNKETVDTHSFVSSPTINAMWGPNPHFSVGYIEHKFVVTKLLSDSIAQAEDIQVGDIILKINGKPIKQRVKELRPLMAGANEAATYRDIANYLLNVGSQPFATIEVERNGTRQTRKISRYPYQKLVKLSDKPKKQELWREVEPGIVWVDFGAIKDTTLLPALFTDLQKAKTVIVDLRKYPNYEVYLRAVPAFFRKDLPVSLSANAMAAYPGFFSTFSYKFEKPAASTLAPYYGNMIVLVNEHTQSMGESCAFNLAQRPATIVMGSQTAGTTGNITWLPLPGGARVAFTGVEERGANGSFEQRNGVRINKVVKPTVASIAAGKDALLEAAVEEARQSMAVRAEVSR